MEEKLKWVLETWFYGSTNSLVRRAILDDSVSLDDFISGFHKLNLADKKELEEGYVPEEFQNV